MANKKHPLTPPKNRAEGLPPDPENEVNLFDLLRILNKKKYLILFITLFFTFVAISYTLKATAVFRVDVAFLMPKVSENGVQSIISAEFPEKYYNQLKHITLQSIYKDFLIQLQSYKNQRNVFDQENYLERFYSDSNKSVDIEKLFQSIHNSITLIPWNGIERMDINKGTTNLVMEGTKPKVMADFLNSLSKKTIDIVKREVKHSAKRLIDGRIIQIPKNIAAINETIKEVQSEKATFRRKKRIAFLSEQLILAKKNKIKKHNFENITGLTPEWFSHGELFLEKEINALKSMSITGITQPGLTIAFSANTGYSGIEDKYYGQIADLKIELKSLQSATEILIEPEVATISRESIASETPITPNKQKIILLGMVLGLLTGILLSFLIHLNTQSK